MAFYRSAGLIIAAALVLPFALAPLFPSAASFWQPGLATITGLFYKLLSSDSESVDPVSQASSPNFPHHSILNHSTFDWHSWTVSSHQLQPAAYQSRISLGNGYTGITLASNGPFFEEDEAVSGKRATNGWPLFEHRQTFATIAGFWNYQDRTPATNYEWLLQYGGESVISGIPHWAALVVCIDGKCYDEKVDRSEIVSFSESYGFRSGIKTTNLTWAPEGPNGTHFELKYATFVIKALPNLGVTRLEVTASEVSQVRIVDLIDGRSAVRTQEHKTGCDDSAIWSSVKPSGLVDDPENEISFEASVYSVFTSSNKDEKPECSSSDTYDREYPGTIKQTVNQRLRKGKPYYFTKYVGLASRDAFTHPSPMAQQTAEHISKLEWNEVYLAQEESWAELVNKDTVALYWEPEGPVPEDKELQLMQIGAIASTHYVLSALGSVKWGTGANDNSLMVGGLGSDAYGGWIFWDAEINVAPGIVVSHPRYAQSIPEYRIKLLNQSRANAQFNPHMQLHPKTDELVYQDLSKDSIIFPWISGRFGNCTAAGPCRDYQYHINSAVAINIWHTYVVTGDDQWLRDRAWPVLKGVAHLFQEKLYWNSTKQGYGLLNMSDPDEYANFVDDGAYTLASVSQIMDIATTVAKMFKEDIPEEWSKIKSHLGIAASKGDILTPEFNGMNGSITIKQWDVGGLVYPLEYPVDFEVATNNLIYYAKAQSGDGPAMSASFLSIAQAELSASTCADYTVAVQSIGDYIRAPWYQYSEQRDDNPATNGGTNPAFPFITGHGGFLQVPVMGWGGFRFHHDRLHLKPKLPPQLTYLQLPTIYWQGAAIKMVIRRTHATITRVPPQDPIYADKYEGRGLPLDIEEDDCHGDGSNVRRYLLNLNDPITVPVAAQCPHPASWFRKHHGPPSILHCANVDSKEPIQQSMYPMAAVDGSQYTFWQPFSPAPATISVQLPEKRCASQAFIDWADTPAKSFKVYAWDDSDDAKSHTEGSEVPLQNQRRTVVIDQKKVPIDKPYNLQEFNELKLREANMTRIPPFKKVCAKRWDLEIRGTSGVGKDAGAGAKVARFALWDRDQLSKDDIHLFGL